MSSIRGFRCRVCGAEVLATAELAESTRRTDWTPRVLCCGQWLRPLEPDQVILPPLTRRRLARCSRCGYKVRLIVHPASPLVCAVCQIELLIFDGTSHQDDHATTSVAQIGDTRPD